MPENQNEVIQLVLDKCFDECGRGQLALLLEDGLKARLIEDLVGGGCVVRVGAHATGIDRLLSSDDNVISWEDARRSSRVGRFCDVYIERPFLAKVELKVFGEVGPKDYPDKPGCVSDLAKVSAGTVDVAVVVASQSAYDALQANTEGYPLAGSYPPRAAIASDTFADHLDLSWGGTALRARARKRRLSIRGIEREHRTRTHRMCRKAERVGRARRPHRPDICARPRRAIRRYENPRTARPNTLWYLGRACEHRTVRGRLPRSSRSGMPSVT